MRPPRPRRRVLVGEGLVVVCHVVVFHLLLVFIRTCAAAQIHVARSKRAVLTVWPCGRRRSGRAGQRWAVGVRALPEARGGPGRSRGWVRERTVRAADLGDRCPPRPPWDPSRARADGVADGGACGCIMAADERSATVAAALCVEPWLCPKPLQLWACQPSSHAPCMLALLHRHRRGHRQQVGGCGHGRDARASAQREGR